jgi:prepilin-type N-terminal cleavage/methylation domain-containing protein
MNRTLSNDTKGFTIIELMIVITIIAIASGLVGISIQSRKHVNDLARAANELYCDFLLAKSTSVLKQELVEMTFDTDRGSYTIMGLGSDGLEGGSGQAEDKIIKTVKLSDYGSGITFGKGCAKVTVPGDTFDNSKDVISYQGHTARFQSNGIVRVLGYVYLTTSKNDLSYAVGTPTHAGIVRMLKTTGDKWVMH